MDQTVIAHHKGMIEPEHVIKLSEEEFKALGVHTIGDRIRLRERCRNKVEDADEDSPFVKRMKLFQSARSRNKKPGLPNNAKSGPTRKLYVGWKHRRPNGYLLVQSNKGGGVHHLDVPKKMDIFTLSKTVEEVFFPEGVNATNSLELNQLSRHLATFSGEKIPETLKEGDLFSVDGYCKQISTVPVRIYLHTETRPPASIGIATPSNTTAATEMHTTNLTVTPATACTGTPTAAATWTPAAAATWTPSTPTWAPTAAATWTPTAAATWTPTAAATWTPTTVTGDPSTPTWAPTAAATWTQTAAATGDPSTGTWNPTAAASWTTTAASTWTPTAAATWMPTAVTGTPTAATGTPTAATGTPTVAFNLRNALQPISTVQDVLPDLNDDSGNSDQELLSPTPETVCDSESLHEILTRLASLTKTEPKNIVNITRHHVMPGVIRAFNRPSFKPEQCLSVKFAGEQAIDDGGPSRELMRLLMKEISALSIFTGNDNQKKLDLNYAALQSGLYRTVGRMIAYTVVHSGPLPRFISPLLYSSIVGDGQIQPTIEDIEDVQQRESLQKIRNSEDVTDFLEAVSEVDQLIQVAGCYSLSRFFSKREDLTKALIHFIVLGRVKECQDQFDQGLSTLGLLAEVRRHPAQMRELFIFDEQYEVSAVAVELLFNVHAFSEPGSNRRVKEEMTVCYWNDYLLDVAEGTETVSLPDVLVFATGAGSIPPLGFDPQPQLLFHAAKEESPEDRDNFPHANTCANMLDLPMISNYTVFKGNMNAAISINSFTSE